MKNNLENEKNPSCIILYCIILCCVVLCSMHTFKPTLYNLVIAVLSPSQMLKHTFALLDGRFDRTMGSQIKDLNINTRKLISVNKEDKLIEAMYKMQEHRTSVVAVVDGETGLLVGNISMSDIR